MRATPPPVSEMPPQWTIIAIVLVLIAGCLLAVGVSGVLVNVIDGPEQAGMKAGMGLSGFEMPGESTRWGFEPGEYRIFYAYRSSLPAFGNAPYTLPATPPEITVQSPTTPAGKRSHCGNQALIAATIRLRPMQRRLLRS